MNPQTVVHLEENAYMEMETTQIKGIDSTNRITRGDLKDGATLEVREKIMTHGKQYAKTDFHVELNGKDSSTNIVSRSVAKGESHQVFFSKRSAVTINVPATANVMPSLWKMPMLMLRRSFPLITLMPA